MAHLKLFALGWLIALLVAPNSGAGLRRRIGYQLQTWTVDLADLVGLWQIACREVTCYLLGTGCLHSHTIAGLPNG